MAPVDVTRWKITKAKPALILPEVHYAYVGVPLSLVNYLWEVEAAGKKFLNLLPPVANIGLKFKCLKHVNELVDGIIDYLTLVLLASMTTEEIFKEAKDFKKKVFYTVQSVLNKFVLKFVDVNRGHEYFSYLEPHNNMQAKIYVSKPRIKGAKIGAKPREALTIQNAAVKIIDVCNSKPMSMAIMKGEIGAKFREVQTTQNTDARSEPMHKSTLRRRRLRKSSLLSDYY